MLENCRKPDNDFVEVLGGIINPKGLSLVSSDLGEDLYTCDDIRLNRLSSEKLWQILRENQSAFSKSQKHLYHLAKKELEQRGQFDPSSPWMAPH